MKKSGAEKKRVRRSSGAVQNGTRDPNSDTPPRKQSAKKDVFQLFAEKVRDHKDLVSRWAVLQETRVEYFRGKDFVSFLKNHPELKDILEANKTFEVEEIANALLKKNLLVRCDRVVKIVRPGKKKVVYLASSFRDLSWVLLLILSLLLVRAATFGALYIILGKRVWFFPNILAEEATLRELFRFWPKKDEEERPKWTTRLFYAVAAVLVILLLRHHAPDEAARARYQKRMSNIIDDVLEWNPRLALSGMMEKQQTVVNATEADDGFADGSKTNSEQMEDEVFGNAEESDQPQHQDHI